MIRVASGEKRGWDISLVGLTRIGVETWGLATLAVQRGVNMRYGVSVESIAVADNRVSGVRIINEQGRKEIMASDAYVACLASYTPRLLAPIGILAFLEYYKAGNVDVKMALLIALGFVFGAYFGGAWAQQIPQVVLRKMFAILLAVTAVKMFFQN